MLFCFEQVPAASPELEKRYAPQAPEDVLDERFVEACHRLPWAEYQLDILLQGDSYERGEVVSELTATDTSANYRPA